MVLCWLTVANQDIALHCCIMFLITCITVVHLMTSLIRSQQMALLFLHLLFIPTVCAIQWSLVVSVASSTDSRPALDTHSGICFRFSTKWRHSSPAASTGTMSVFLPTDRQAPGRRLPWRLAVLWIERSVVNPSLWWVMGRLEFLYSCFRSLAIFWKWHL